MRAEQTLDAVVGRPVARDGEGPAKRVRIVVQPVPGRPMSQAWWEARTADTTSPYAFPVFEPPAMRGDPLNGIPHINLDLALEFLLGDRLQ